MELRLSDFDFELPSDRIAQEPASERTESRLMVLSRQEHTIRHDVFHNLGRYLVPGDVLVANRSRVIPARLLARKPTGGQIELLLLRPIGDNYWVVLGRPSRKLAPDMTLQVRESPLRANIVGKLGDGQWEVKFSGAGDISRELAAAGRIPFPPYISNPQAPVDRYQTVYADQDGSIAAPTAGLHFSDQLLESLKHQGVQLVFLTLHVGLGTFRPVKVDRVSEHRMHAEWGEVPGDAAETISAARRQRRRVIAIGTTSVRLLETATQNGTTAPFQGETDIFLYPGKPIKSIDGLVTNFHLPRSTLLMLVSAFAGRELIREAYDSAIAEKYRFYSFGDAMLIL